MSFVLCAWQAQTACQGMEEKERTAINQGITIDQKIGQCIMVGFTGTEPTDEKVQTACDFLKQNLSCNVILYADNIVDPGQLKWLTGAIHQANSKALIAITGQGGLGERLRAQKGFEDIFYGSINATCGDLFKFPNNSAAAQDIENFKAHDGLSGQIVGMVKQDIQNGKINEEHIIESYQTFMDLKERLLQPVKSLGHQHL